MHSVFIICGDNVLIYNNARGALCTCLHESSEYSEFNTATSEWWWLMWILFSFCSHEPAEDHAECSGEAGRTTASQQPQSDETSADGEGAAAPETAGAAPAETSGQEARATVFVKGHKVNIFSLLCVNQRRTKDEARGGERCQWNVCVVKWG